MDFAALLIVFTTRNRYRAQHRNAPSVTSRYDGNHDNCGPNSALYCLYHDLRCTGYFTEYPF